MEEFVTFTEMHCERVPSVRCTLTLSVFIAQNVALPNFGVENHQQSNGAIRSSLATLCDDVRRHAASFNH